MSNKTDLSIYDNRFHSEFAPYILQFLAMKDTAGNKLGNYLPALTELDRYARESGQSAEFVTQTFIEDVHHRLTGAKPITVYEKFCIIGQFCRYLVKQGIPCHIPIYPRKPKKSYVPYIYTMEELHRLFEAADNLQQYRRQQNSVIFSFPILLRLLYSTGMRIGEAVKLCNSDVDMNTRAITIRNSKNNMERQVPITESLFFVIAQYIAKRSKLPVNGADAPDAPFLVALDGSPVGISIVGHWFHRILKDAGIIRIPGRGPRIHDLRHTFAVHALEQLSRNGEDSYCTLPVLSVALGHKCVSDTEYYVRITKEVYPEIMELTSAISEHIFPTISTLQ